MSFICKFCDSANPDDLQYCQTCGAKRGARVRDYVPGALSMLGVLLLVLAGFVFYNSYPPGTRVDIWSLPGGHTYSSVTSIALTTALPLVVGLACIFIDFLKKFRRR